MNALTAQRYTEAADADAYFAAVSTAKRRALHSYYDQHVLSDHEAGYVAIDEGDYNALPITSSNVVHTVHGQLLDEY